MSEARNIFHAISVKYCYYYYLNLALLSNHTHDISFVLPQKVHVQIPDMK